MLVKLDSSFSAESISSLTLFSAAATCAYKNTRLFPICTARRSVGVGDLGFIKDSDGANGVDLVGAASAVAS